MEKIDCFLLGQIIKPFGIKGEMVLYLNVDVPEKYSDLKSIFIESKDLLEEYKVEGIRLKQNQAFVKLEGINKIEETERFLKARIYLPLFFLPDLGERNFYLHEVIGFLVNDKKHGNLGTLKEILDMPGQRLLQINNGMQEILVPLNIDFVDKVDRIGKTLHLNTPEGLIDIYLNPNSPQE